MTLGYTDGKTKIKIFILIFGLLSISTFTIFELRKVISGPKISLNCKKCTNINSDKYVYTLSGQAKNVSDIFIGNRKIFISKNGEFKENILLYPGNNLINIKSIDRFGQEVKKDIEIYYNDKISLAKIK